MPEDATLTTITLNHPVNPGTQVEAKTVTIGGKVAKRQLVGQRDGADETQGHTTDAEAPTGDGTLVALFKRVRSLLAGGLPAALTALGNLKVALQEEGAATPTRSDVTASATSVQLAAANVARRGLTISNDSDKTLYVLCAAGSASATNFTTTIPSKNAEGHVSSYEVSSRYVGVINGIWVTGVTGAARMTEFTP